MISLSYREYPPPVDLARWIACFWVIKGSAAQRDGFAHRVLPDGCADLLFDLSEGRGNVPRAGIVGPMSMEQVVELGVGTDLLGVRLRPGALGAFLAVPADELLDREVPLSEAPAVLRVEAGQLAELPNTGTRIALLIDACRARLAALTGFDPIVGRALTRWSQSAVASPSVTVGFPSVAVLVRDIGLSERAFERRFVANVGLTPVRFRRLARLRAVLRLYSAGGRDWAAMAAAAGFSDQSHLVRDFRAFVGLSPTRWAATQAANAGFFQDGQITAL